MSDATAIGLVSESLQTLLRKKLGLRPMPKVTLLAPDETGDSFRVNLFLYRIAEHPFLRNQDWSASSTRPDQVVAPPLSLTLTYLLTAYAPNDSATGNSSAHKLLGAAMRVFHEYPELPEEYLGQGLTGVTERLRILGDTLDPEAIGRFWTTFATPFRPSVAYQVSPVQLDLAADPRPVARRVRRTELGEAEVPFAPPAVVAMAPVRGRAGTVLTFTGTDLKDWRGNVRVGGRLVTDDLPLGGNEFTSRLPDPLAAGVYDVQVEVSGLFRRTFVFEVVP